ncbi:MAG: hypothetical protein WAL36_07860, partial [Pseudolabrys sp.]
NECQSMLFPSALIPMPGGGMISLSESTKAEYKERQPAVQKSFVCGTFAECPSSPLDRTKHQPKASVTLLICRLYERRGSRRRTYLDKKA